MAKKNEQETKKGKWGGYRPGSGRKKSSLLQIPLNLRVSQEAFDLMQGVEAKSEFIDSLIKKELGEK